MVMPNGRERLAQDRASRARREEARDLLHIVSEQHGGARGDALAVRVAIDGVVLTERCMKLEGECEALRRLVLQVRADLVLARERTRQAEERAEAAPGQARAAVEDELEALRLALARATEEAREVRAEARAEVAQVRTEAEAQVQAARAEGQAGHVLAELQATQARLEQAWAELARSRELQAIAESERAAAVVRASRAQGSNDTLRYRAKLATERADGMAAELEVLRAEAQARRAAAVNPCLAVVDELEHMGRRHRELADRLSAPWLAGPHPVAVAVRALGAAAAAAPDGSAERGAARMALAALVTEALRTCPGAGRPARASGGEA